MPLWSSPEPSCRSKLPNRRAETQIVGRCSYCCKTGSDRPRSHRTTDLSPTNNSPPFEVAIRLDHLIVNWRIVELSRSNWPTK